MKEYLESREREVVDIMMTLYDEEEIMRSYVRSEVREAVQEAVQETQQDERMNTAREMIRDHESIEKIMKYSRLSREAVLKLQKQEEL